MGLNIDSQAVLRAIADHPDTFSAVRGDIDEFARKILAKQIKHKTTDLGGARLIQDSVGMEALATILDGFAANETSALLKKLDPHNGLVKDSNPLPMRAAIDALIQGRAEPTQKQAKTPKTPAKRPTPKAPAKPKIGDILESKVHAGDAPVKKSRGKKASS